MDQFKFQLNDQDLLVQNSSKTEVIVKNITKSSSIKTHHFCEPLENTNIIDCGKLDDSALITWMKEENSFKIRIIPINESENHITHEIKPYELMMYRHPFWILIKEQTELIILNMEKKRVSYIEHEDPVIFKSSSSQTLTSQVHLLIDAEQELVPQMVTLKKDGSLAFKHVDLRINLSIIDQKIWGKLK